MLQTFVKILLFSFQVLLHLLFLKTGKSYCTTSHCINEERGLEIMKTTQNHIVPNWVKSRSIMISAFTLYLLHKYLSNCLIIKFPSTSNKWKLVGFLAPLLFNHFWLKSLKSSLYMLT